MKSLIVEDDFSSRFLLQRLLKQYGDCHVAVNGKEAVSAYRMALDAGQPYDLVCLDIMMPEMDGHAALKEMRAMEELKGIDSTHGEKIILAAPLEVHPLRQLDLLRDDPPGLFDEPTMSRSRTFSWT